MHREGEGKLSDSWRVGEGIVAHNILKNHTLCVMSPSVKVSDSPPCTSSSPAHHAKSTVKMPIMAIWYCVGSSALNRGHEHHRAIRRCRICEGRPRRFGGVQRGGGTWNANSSRTVQQWSVIPAAMAGVRLVAAMPVAWAAGWGRA